MTCCVVLLDWSKDTWLNIISLLEWFLSYYYCFNCQHDAISLLNAECQRANIHFFLVFFSSHLISCIQDLWRAGLFCSLVVWLQFVSTYRSTFKLTPWGAATEQCSTDFEAGSLPGYFEINLESHVTMWNQWCPVWLFKSEWETPQSTAQSRSTVCTSAELCCRNPAPMEQGWVAGHCFIGEGTSMLSNEQFGAEVTVSVHFQFWWNLCESMRTVLVFFLDRPVLGI